MIRFIDVSNHQGRAGMDLSKVLPSVGGVICKATEGIGFVDAYCDKFVQTCIKAGKPWGFYHFGRNNGATAEADFFRRNTSNYEGHGIPVLDWESGQSVDWVNEFVRHYHDLTGIWPWIYSNAWCFNQGEVETNCGRWIAGYPQTGVTSFDFAEQHQMPYTVNNGLVCAWQFTSSGRLDGYGSNLDLDVFYGDAKAWSAYATAGRDGNEEVEESKRTVTITGDFEIEEG